MNRWKRQRYIVKLVALLCFDELVPLAIGFLHRPFYRDVNQRLKDFQLIAMRA